jgi:hypothetical protein
MFSAVVGSIAKLVRYDFCGWKLLPGVGSDIDSSI